MSDAKDSRLSLVRGYLSLFGTSGAAVPDSLRFHMPILMLNPPSPVVNPNLQ